VNDAQVNIDAAAALSQLCWTMTAIAMVAPAVAVRMMNGSRGGVMRHFSSSSALVMGNLISPLEIAVIGVARVSRSPPLKANPIQASIDACGSYVKQHKLDLAKRFIFICQGSGASDR
jgi:hypothetical protein